MDAAFSPSNFSLKSYEEWDHGRAARDGFALVPPITIVRRGKDFSAKG
jgi:hypothetical protein